MLARVLRETLAGALLDEVLERLHELLEVGHAQFAVQLDLGVVLDLLDDDLKGFVVLAGTLLHAHDDIAVHLEEAAVAVVGETGVARLVGDDLDGGVVHAEVEDRVHHARHGIARAGTDGKQERIFAAAEFLADALFDLGERLFDLRVQLRRVRLLVVVEIGADFRGDREAGGHRQADAGHFREVGALAAEERFHGAVAVRAAVAEIINVFALRGLDRRRGRRLHGGRLLRGGATGGSGLERRAGFHLRGFHRLGRDEFAVRLRGLLAGRFDGERITFRGGVAGRRGGCRGAALEGFDRRNGETACGGGIGWHEN